jgi:uncharacterized protein YceH (UPF0502 family)
VQRRVIGVLIEKSLTTAAGYPMTLNSLVTGCNQLTCREPVMSLSEGEVARALHELQIWPGGGLVRQAEGDRTARANRFEHLAETRFAWDKRQRAIITELFLRGPQTAGELKTNAGRMATFDDLQMIMNVLADLARHDPPYVHELPRQPGRSTVRFDHLFYAENRSEVNAVEPTIARSASPSVSSSHEGLESRLARLEAELARLRSEFEAFRTGPTQ